METKNLLNKKITQWLLLVAMLVGCSASAFGTDFDNSNTRMSGIRVKYTKDGGSETQAYYKINDTTNSWENGGCKMTIPNTSFGGVNFGNVKSLYLTEGWLNARVTGCGTGCNDYAEARFSYKVWKSGGSEPGSYTNAFTANTWCGGSRWEGASDMTITVTGQNVNVTSGLSSGTYNLKVKMEMQARWSGGTFGDTYTYEKTATFTIPATCTDPTATQYPMTNATKTYGSVSAPTITPASGAGTVKTIYYTGVSPTSYSKSSNLPTNAGTYKVTVDVNAGSTYCAKNGIDLSGNFVINKANQSALTFNGSTQCVDTEVTLSATGGLSGETITYTKKSGTGTVSGTTLTTSTAGDVVVTATRPGGANYNDVTADATFTFTAKPVAGTVTGGGDICTAGKGTQTQTLTASGYTGSIQWQKASSESGSYSDIGSATSATYQAGEAGWYRVKVSNGQCSSVYSNAVQVVGYSSTVAGNVTGAATICSGEFATLTASGYRGTIRYWMVSTDAGSSWTNLTEETSSTYTPTNITTTSRYKVSVSGICGSGGSGYAIVTVNPQNAIGSVTFDNSTIKKNATTTAHANDVVTSGDAGSWSSDNTSVATVNASTGVVTGQSVGVANIIFTLPGGCNDTSKGAVNSKSAQISVISDCDAPTTGTIGGTLAVCAGSGTTLTLTGYETTNTSLQWYKDDAIISGAKSAQYSTENLNASATYKVRVTRTNVDNCYADAPAVTVNVTQIPSITAQGDSRCGNGEVTLQATATPDGRCRVDWYDAATGGDKQGEGLGKEVNVTVGNPVTLYAEAVTTGAVACKSASRASATATAKVVPSVSNIALTGSGECGAGDVTFTATATQGSTVNWFEGASAAGSGNEKIVNIAAGGSKTLTAKATMDGCTEATGMNATGTRKANPSLTIGVTSSAITAGEIDKTYGWEYATFTASSSTDGATVTGGITQTTEATVGKAGIIEGNKAKGHVGDAFTGSYTATKDGCSTNAEKTVTVIKATEVCGK